MGQGSRRISASALARAEDERGPEAFLEQFMPKVSSTLAPPNFPSSFLKPVKEQEEGGPIPEKLTFNLFLPHSQHTKNAEVSLL